MVAARGYSALDAAKLLDLSVDQVRSFARAGLVEAERGPRREYRFSFQDLVLLRVARDLSAARIPRRRIRRSLAQLKASLPSGRSLSGVRIAAEQDHVVVHDGSKRWSPESGQLHFSFEVAELVRRAAPLAQRQAAALGAADLSVDAWYEFACEMEAPAPDAARDAYRRVLRLDPDHVDARVNLGRLLHEAGEPGAAEEQYLRALAVREDATAAFNLGVALEDQERLADALAAYERALRADPAHADAHFNAAGLCRRIGRHADALRHLKRYRELTSRS
ncbi:MAG: tetratricopeptide repeat protein [Planctomycetota bacterium]|jgi:tetratricopeptide (TPR) repeat protein